MLEEAGHTVTASAIVPDDPDAVTGFVLDQLETTMQSGGSFGMRTMDSAIQALLEKRQISGREAFNKGINKSKFEAVRDQG